MAQLSLHPQFTSACARLFQQPGRSAPRCLTSIEYCSAFFHRTQWTVRLFSLGALARLSRFFQGPLRTTSGCMKILFSSYAYAPGVGGIETVSSLLARAFLAAGHEIVLVTETPAATGPTGSFPVLRN